MQNASQEAAAMDLPDLAALGRLGRAISVRLERGDAIALRGDLGAGKTSLARAILQARGHEGDVPSPTFTLLQSYALNDLIIAHLDLYRLKAPEEIAELGFEDALAVGAALIEWPEQAEDHMPDDRLDVFLEIEPHRHARLKGHGVWLTRVADILKDAA